MNFLNSGTSDTNFNTYEFFKKIKKKVGFISGIYLIEKNCYLWEYFKCGIANSYSIIFLIFDFFIKKCNILLFLFNWIYFFLWSKKFKRIFLKYRVMTLVYLYLFIVAIAAASESIGPKSVQREDCRLQPFEETICPRVRCNNIRINFFSVLLNFAIKTLILINELVPTLVFLCFLSSLLTRIIYWKSL